MSPPAEQASDLQSLKGVGPALAEKLAGLGIRQQSDLLFHLPLRYEDRVSVAAIGSLLPGQRISVIGEVQHAAIVPGRRRMLVVSLNDGSGSLTLRFFHFRHNQYLSFKKGLRLRCFGEVRGGYQGLEMIHPNYRRVTSGEDDADADASLTPVYPTTEGLQQPTWLRLTGQVLASLEDGSLTLDDLLPADWLQHWTPSGAAYSLTGALQLIHRPPPGTDTGALEQREHPAQQRLALEELLAHHLSVRRLHQRQRRLPAPALAADGASHLESTFIERLPFTLTAAQQRVIGEIRQDLSQDHPMQRLLQGDVGCGKTVVAALAALRAAGNGWQCAITAPTELLAEQHLHSFSQWLAPLGLEPVWLSSRVTGKARTQALARLSGDGCEPAPLAIGTHALMQQAVSFARLGLVVVDEQHRFGVHQRLQLRDKGRDAGLLPHQLIMTATPIPRTLAMTSYAGLAVSVIDQLPPGRQPVTTVAVSEERRAAVLERVAAACAEGRQAYWVCTLIEESDSLEAQAAEATATELARALPQLRTALVHGRMKSKDKQAVMAAFKAGEVDLLVATTVIEVGVDVPNASLMMIENAERLGLSQLHQLRGRVGRGSQQAACVLLYRSPLGDMARQRLGILRQSTDGFVIAEKDLQLRGPGEVLGTRQTGALQFRVADLGRDAQLLEQVPQLAEQLERERPKLGQRLIRRWVGDADRYLDA